MSTKDKPGDAPKGKKRFRTPRPEGDKFSRAELQRLRTLGPGARGAGVGLGPPSANDWARRAKWERSKRAQEHLDAARAERISQAARRVRSIFATLQLPADEQVDVLRTLIDEKAAPTPCDASPAVPLPAAPPELWSDREGRKENPVKFIRRVYGPWLGRGLMRAHLRELDQPLYRAYAVWLHRNPDDVIAELPDVADVTDSLIAQLPDNVDLDLVRRVGLALHHRKSRHAPDEEK